MTFCDWLLLNQSVKEELKGPGLRDITSKSDNPVYQALLNNFKQ